MGEEPARLELTAADELVLPALPATSGPRRRGRFVLQPLFLACVALPTCGAGAYFGLFASDIYVSEARFVVRSPARATGSPLGALLGGGALSGASEEANAVIAYVRSRDALASADADDLVRRAYGAQNVSWFDRFGNWLSGDSDEQLHEYFQDKVSVENDASLQVTRLSVEAYSPRDAQAIAERLLGQSEALVNRLADRARDDAIAVADAEVAQAQGEARSAAVALAAFRNAEGILDPAQEAEVRLQMVSKLQDELIATRNQLEQLESFTPQASQIPYLRNRLAALEREIETQTGSIAGGAGSLSGAVVRYQELQLDGELAERQLAASIASREEARAEARRKIAYLERIAQPSLPDYPAGPQRLRGILATFVLGLLVWGILSMLLAGVREHRD